MNIHSLRDLPRPRTVLGWTTVVMVGWLAVVFFIAAVAGQNPLLVAGGWLCLFTPVLLVVALVDRAITDRRGARGVHQQGAAWQVPAQPQLPPMPPQPMNPQPTYQPPADHNPWA